MVFGLDVVKCPGRSTISATGETLKIGTKSGVYKHCSSYLMMWCKWEQVCNMLERDSCAVKRCLGTKLATIRSHFYFACTLETKEKNQPLCPGIEFLMLLNSFHCAEWPYRVHLLATTWIENCSHSQDREKRVPEYFKRDSQVQLIEWY